MSTMGAHEHILTALQRLFTKAGCRSERKKVPHIRGMKKVDLLIKDFQLVGVRKEPSHPDVKGTLDASVKEKLDNYQHFYNSGFWTMSATFSSCRLMIIMSFICCCRNKVMRPLGESVGTSSACLSHRRAANYFTRKSSEIGHSILDPPPPAFKQRRGTYFYYSRAVTGLACAQATASRLFF
jgi:hypothetical protein